MNFNICEKCAYKTKKYFLDFISEKEVKFLGVYNKDTEHFCNLTAKYNFNTLYQTMSLNKIKKEFNDLNPQDDCPYYVEHKLSEWNK